MFGVPRECAVLSRQLQSGLRHPVRKRCVLCCIRAVCGEDAHAHVGFSRREKHGAQRLCRITTQLEDPLRRGERLRLDPCEVARYVARREPVQRVEHAGCPLVPLVLLGDDGPTHTHGRPGEDHLPRQNRGAAWDLWDDRIIRARDRRHAERGKKDQRRKHERKRPGCPTRHLCAYFFLWLCECISDAMIETVRMLSTTKRLTSGGIFQSWLMAGRIIFTPIHISTNARPVPRKWN